MATMALTLFYLSIAGGKTDPGAAGRGGGAAVRGWRGWQSGGVPGRTHDAQEGHRARRQQGQGLQVHFSHNTRETED